MLSVKRMPISGLTKGMDPCLLSMKWERRREPLCGVLEERPKHLEKKHSWHLLGKVFQGKVRKKARQGVATQEHIGKPDGLGRSSVRTVRTDVTNRTPLGKEHANLVIRDVQVSRIAIEKTLDYPGLGTMKPVQSSLIIPSSSAGTRIKSAPM